MNKNKKQASFINIGSSSLLIIFLILCLATFAILSLSSAKSDYSFSQKLAAHKTAYYNASSQAELIVKEIDALLEETAQNTAAPSSSEDFLSSSYITAVVEALNGKSIKELPLSCTLSDSACIVTFLVPSGEQQALEVSVQIMDYTSNPYYYEIAAWKAVTLRDNEEQPLNLISADESE